MKFRAALIGIIGLVACISGCTTAYRNSQLCKQKMVETYPADQPALTYSIPHTSYRGARVVVEATRRVVYPTPVGSTLLKAKTYEAPAAVECTFDDDKLQSFQWLAPTSFTHTADVAGAPVRPAPEDESAQPIGQPGFSPGSPLILPSR
jgi:hypothetical protein